jgi:cytochrome c553
MSQPPNHYFPHIQQPQHQQSQQPQHQQYQQQQYLPHIMNQQPPQYNPLNHYLLMQQQFIPQQQPNQVLQQNTQFSSKQPHWFDRMCEVITTQQSRHEAGSLETPPMLTPGNYVQWSSRFLRFLELKKPHGQFLKQVILEGPFEWPTRFEAGDPNADPPRPPGDRPLPETALTEEQKLHREADQYAMAYILQGIPNPIYRSVDAQKTAKAMWEHVHLLMEGTQLNKDDMESKLYMEYTDITIEPGESLESYYHRFTNVVNDLERHKITVPRIAVNSKFVGSLGPDWHKYVTFVRQTKNLHDAPYGLLYDFLKHHEPEVAKDRALRGGYTPTSTPNSLALIAQSPYAPPPMSNHAYVQEQNYFSYPQSSTSNQMAPYDSSLQNDSAQLVPLNKDAVYYSNSNDDDDDDFNTLNQGLALIARAFSKFSNKTNNRQRSSSNTRNQAVVNDGRVEIQNRSYGRSGSGKFSGNYGNGQRFSNNGGFRNNSGSSQQRSESVATRNSNSGNAVWCYNCNEQGHIATACPKPRTRGSKFHKQALLLALQDEKDGHFPEQDNNFMANVNNDDDMEDLEANAAVMLMANMQELKINDSGPVYDTDGLSQVHDLNKCFINEIVSPSASESDTAQVVPSDSSSSSQADEQISTVVIFDDDTVVSFDDPIENDKNDQVEQHEPSFYPDPDLLLLSQQLNAQQVQINLCNEKNKALKETNASLSRDIECYKLQLSNQNDKIKHSKSFEKAFHDSYNKEQDLQHKMQDLIESNGKLVSKLESEKCDLKLQVERLQKELSKTETELSNCKKEFCEHKIRKRKYIDDILLENVDLAKQLKEFQNIVYKTGGSVTTIQKYTLKTRPEKGFALGDYNSRFLNKAFKENPKIYSMDFMFDDTIVRTVVHDTEEEEELEEESRSKMSQVKYCKPYDYSKAPHISKSFVPQKEIPEKSWYITESYVSSHNAVHVPTVAQINGPLPSSGEVTPLPKNCRILNFFKTFMEDIDILEETIARNSEIKVETFQSAYEREKRDIFQKQMLPIVKHLRRCATLWEHELQHEVKTMINVFESNANTILVQKQRNKGLKNDADRLLEQVLSADILSVIMNDLYKSGTTMLMDDLCVDNNLLNEEIEILKNENEILRKNNDDVCKQFSNESLQLRKTLDLYEARSMALELQIQSHNISKSCQLCKKLESFKSLCLKYEKEIEFLKKENAEWEQNSVDFKYCIGLLESEIQDKKHIIIDFKEKIKLLEKGQFVDTTVIAPGMYELNKKGNYIQTTNDDPSTSTGLVSTKSVSRPKRKSIKKNRFWQRKRGSLEVQEVEDHLRNLNKNHVASDLDSNLANCNQDLNVTNDVPLNVLNINASCVFCRKNVSSGDHTKCVANSLLNRHKKRRTGIPFRSTTASKSTLGKPPSTVFNDVEVTPIILENKSRNKPKTSAFNTKKAKTSWIWQRWLQHKPDFKWIPKLLKTCASNQQEPALSLGSTLTSVPSSSSSCDAGGTDNSLDC